jgi:hypothetical protein
MRPGARPTTNECPSTFGAGSTTRPAGCFGSCNRLKAKQETEEALTTLTIEIGHCGPMAYVKFSQPNLFPPQLIRYIDGELELCPLLVLAEDVALFRGREAALGGDRELIERRELGGFIQARLDVFLLFELAEL